MIVAQSKLAVKSQAAQGLTHYGAASGWTYFFLALAGFLGLAFLAGLLFFLPKIASYPAA
jgi:hypothetical protein